MNLEHTKAKANEIAGNVKSIASSFFTEQGKRKRAEELVERVKDNNILQDITASRNRTPVGERVSNTLSSNWHVETSQTAEKDMIDNERKSAVEQAISSYEPYEYEEYEPQPGDTLREVRDENARRQGKAWADSIGIGALAAGADAGRDYDYGQLQEANELDNAGFEPPERPEEVEIPNWMGSDWYPQQTTHGDARQWDFANFYSMRAPERPDSALYVDNSFFGNERKSFDLLNGSKNKEPDTRPDSARVGGNTWMPGARGDFETPYQGEPKDFPVDDGTADYDHVTSMWITGTELQRQADAGLIDMRGDYIDPSKVYNKVELYNDYGYVPFLPDAESKAKWYQANASYISTAPQRFLTGLRPIIGSASDYTVNVGDDMSFSGKDFDRQYQAYMNQVSHTLSLDEHAYDHPPADDTPYTAYVQRTVVEDANGELFYAYGSLLDAVPNDDGRTWTLSFSDGNDIVVDQDWLATQVDENDVIDFKDSNRVAVDDMSMLSDEILENEAVFMPDLVLPDGTTIPFDVALSIGTDKERRDGEIDSITGGSIHPTMVSYENYQPFLDQPVGGGDELFSKGENDEFTVNRANRSMVPQFFDMLNQSLPLMIPYAAYPMALASAAYTGPYGIDSFSYDPTTGSYAMIDPAMDRYGNLYSNASDADLFLSTALTAGLPFTERLAGGIGKGSVQELIASSLFKNAKKRATTRAGRYAAESLWEGVEEIPGNFWEEMQRSGTDAFGNELEATMPGGRNQLDPNTSVDDRVSNFLDPVDLANAFVGGAAMGAFMTAPRLAGLPADWYRDFVDMKEEKRKKKEDQEVNARIDAAVDAHAGEENGQ